MPDMEKGNKKLASEKVPVPMRIRPETADKFRTVAKEFTDQESALNGLMAAYEREKIQLANPQFAEDMQMFESYQRYLSTKYTEILNALATAEERAKNNVQKLLDSKDSVIQELQDNLEKAKVSKSRYEEFYQVATNEKEKLEEEVRQRKLALEGQRKEMEEKEEQYASSLSDKERLNEILSKNVEEAQEKLKLYAEYPKQFQEKEEKIKELTEQVHQLESQQKEEEYRHRMELLEMEKQHEKERAAQKEVYDAKMSELRDKHEMEKDRLREKLEEYQSKIQSLVVGKK